MLSAAPKRLDDAALHRQVRDLFAEHEPEDGWSVDEMEEKAFIAWCRGIVGFRREIEHFDLTAKLSQEQHPDDVPGILAGLRRRGGHSDQELAGLISAVRHGVWDEPSYS